MSKKAVLGFESLENKQLLAITNDISINDQWALNSINVAEAWRSTVGSKNQVVAILDSGIDLTHQDLINNVWSNVGEIMGDGIDNEGNGYIDDVYGWNFIDNNNNVQDRYGHGSHVAGVIGAQGNNGVGIAGINWNVGLMSLKIIGDTGIGYSNAIIRAIDYIVMMKEVYNVNIVAVNASWASPGGFSQIMYDQIAKLNNNNILFVTAAGNSGQNNDLISQYPSCYDLDNVISVGALSNDGINLAGLSNYGSESVDLAAPGIMILSTLPYNNYGRLSGTSMAAPQVAGAAALLYAAKPDLNMMQVKAAIFGSVDKIPELFGKVSTGGKLSVGAAVDGVLGIPYNSNHIPNGDLTLVSFTKVNGWAIDPDSPNVRINAKLIIDGIEKSMILTGINGVFSFNLGGLNVGDHVIEVLVKDVQTGSWSSIGSRNIKIQPPMVAVTLLNSSRIVGWAFSERSAASPVMVRLIVNNRLVASRWANQYRPSLKTDLGSANHGFNFFLSRYWLHKGTNDIRIVVYDPISKQVSECWKGTINK